MYISSYTYYSTVAFDGVSAVYNHTTGYNGLNLASSVFFGGVSNFSSLHFSYSASETGFSGCVADASLNSIAIDLSQATVSQNVSNGPCEQTQTCGAQSCLNGGVCSNTFDAYTCACQTYYFGGNCSQGQSHVLTNSNHSLILSTL